MNHLAHLHLAGGDPGLVLGGMLGDYVKGRLDRQYEGAVMRGIRLHRRIDAFTDAHPIPGASRTRFTPPWRRFAGVIVDLCYDHFLARHWTRFADVPLEEFSTGVYALLRDNLHRLPPRLQAFVPRLIQADLFGAYRELDAVEWTLGRLSRRLRNPLDLAPAMDQVAGQYAGLESDFLEFFPQLARRVRTWRDTLAG